MCHARNRSSRSSEIRAVHALVQWGKCDRTGRYPRITTCDACAKSLVAGIRSSKSRLRPRTTIRRRGCRCPLLLYSIKVFGIVQPIVQIIVGWMLLSIAPERIVHAVWASTCGHGPRLPARGTQGTPRVCGLSVVCVCGVYASQPRQGQRSTISSVV
jgi:hypothetical protein